MTADHDDATGTAATAPDPDGSPIDDWFARRTFVARDLDPAELVERKRHRGLSVSVVLPARNEALTIGGVTEAAMALHGGLVDEVVVMDGRSTDDTAGIARRLGATVHVDAEVLDRFGPALGKGDALWRSLHVTSGDLVAFVDTDIRNPHPRFVWGILAPLLLDDGIAFVKGFYDRPIDTGGGLQPSGGGRVTELMARPLLNLFWPRLAGLVQPLSGEYAGRRDVLEQVPFLTGYGVEIGLLIDILAGWGADAIAQCDIERRIHRNQDLPDLSRMSFAILQVALGRLADSDRLRLDGTAGPQYVQFARDDDGRVAPAARQVADTERPPLRSLPEHAPTG